MTLTDAFDPDTQAALLLCGYFGRSDLKPLNLSEYNAVAGWLHRLELRPAELLGAAGRDALRSWDDPKLTAERLGALLGRGVALGFAAERWTGQGFWVLSRASGRYPGRLKRLKSLAPVLLYGVGDMELLDRGGLAVVGSRNADEGASRFTNALAERCAAERISVISGDAKGVDREAMTTALDHRGEVVGVLAEGVARASRKRDYRGALAEGRLALVAATFPEAPWSVANAMNRNKYLYALSDDALVVVSGVDGGTWAGATENLKRGWVRLLVRSDAPLPEGNRALLERGGVAFGSEHLAAGVPLKGVLENIAVPEKGLEPSVSPPPADEPTLPNDLFGIVWPYLRAALAEPQTPEELGARFNVQRTQMERWLKRAAAEEGVRRLTKPVRYVLEAQTRLPF